MVGILSFVMEYWVYAAIDADRNEALSMRVFPSRNVLATRLFIEEALKHRDGMPTFGVDSAPWLTGVLKELGLRCNVEPFRR
jgi:transposase-like protein